jgi:excisionase family DNA binding protein
MTLTTPQAAQYIGMSPRFLEKRRLEGGGPPFIKVGRAIRYRETDLDQFLEDHVVGSTSEATARAAEGQ